MLAAKRVLPSEEYPYSFADDSRDGLRRPIEEGESNLPHQLPQGNSQRQQRAVQGTVSCDLHFGMRSTPGRLASATFSSRHPCRTLVSTVFEAGSHSVSGQVACQMALEHFVSGLFSLRPSDLTHLPLESLSGHLMEKALATANQAVYELGHQLAAGGRVTASCVGLIIAGSSVSVARIARGAAYLYRRGQMFPFFPHEVSLTHAQLLLGTTVEPSMELVSVKLKKGDRLLLFPQALDEALEEALVEVVQAYPEYSLQELFTEIDPDLPNHFRFSACLHTF